MPEIIYKTSEELVEKAAAAIGIPFSEIEKGARLATQKNKGGIGQMFEESWFGMKVNSRGEADFSNLGIELKVTPFITNKNGKRVSKERLVLNIINYMEEYKKTFETSSFWLKNQKILMMFYQHIRECSRDNYSVQAVLLYQYPEEDLIIIKKDWEIIVDKIKSGKAHEISERDTMYLSACTKGSGGDRDLREQPFNGLKAKQRAFSLKNSYMTYVLNSYAMPEDEIAPKVIEDSGELEEKGFESYLVSKIEPYFGRTQESLAREFELNVKSKSVNERIVAKILGIKGSISDSEEFKKANIVTKTIRIQANNTVKESMSFPTFKFTEIVEEEWENSYMYNLFESTKFFFIIFKFDSEGDLKLHNVMFWTMPLSDIKEVQKVWTKTKEVVQNGIVVAEKVYESGFSKKVNNLPGSSWNKVSHVRPHGQNAADCYPLPQGGEFTKQCFWLNNSYILKQVSQN